MADLESTLHYSLRVELAAHPVIKGEALISLKKYISVLAKVQIPERSLHTHIQYTHKRHTKRFNQIKYIDLGLIILSFFFCLFCLFGFSVFI